MSTTAKRTDLDMLDSGVWAKVGREGGKAGWRHASGATVTFACNDWVWVARKADGEVLCRSRNLWWCRCDVEAKCEVVWSDTDKVGA